MFSLEYLIRSQFFILLHFNNAKIVNFYICSELQYKLFSAHGIHRLL